MSRLALNEVDIEAFRSRAISAATKLFAERGYDAVTMRGIATEIGCSPMTPYRYFTNKDEILAMVRAEGFHRFADGQERTFAATDDVQERLQIMGEAYVTFALDEPDTYRVMFELRGGASDPYPELVKAEKRALSFLVAAVDAAIGEGLFTGDPLTIAHHFWAHIHGTVSLHLAGMLHIGRTLDDMYTPSTNTMSLFCGPALSGSGRSTT